MIRPQSFQLIFAEVRQYLRDLNSLKRHKIQTVTLFITNRCNSRCIICDIWRQKPKVDLPIERIKNILEDKILSNKPHFVVTGGEAVLHPKIDQILSLLSDHDVDITLLSNAILADKIVKLVKEFKIRNLGLSLDGKPNVNRKIRGFDQNKTLRKIITELKDDEINIWINYTICPLNTREDFMWVKNLTKKMGVGFTAGIYSDKFIGKFQRGNKLSESPSSKLPYDISDLIKSPYLRLLTGSYKLWASGNLRLPCFSIHTKATILPDGKVNLCEGKNVSLGNLHEQKLGEIWNSIRTIKLHKDYIDCNDCWVSCHRLFDLRIVMALGFIVPTPFLNKFFGPYDWEKVGSFRLIGELIRRLTQPT